MSKIQYLLDEKAIADDVGRPFPPEGKALEKVLLTLTDLQTTYTTATIKPLFAVGQLVTPKRGRSWLEGHPHIVLETRLPGLQWLEEDETWARLDVRTAWLTEPGGVLRDEWNESFNFEPWKAPEAEG